MSSRVNLATAITDTQSRSRSASAGITSRSCSAPPDYGSAQNQARRRHTGAGGDEHVLDVGHRVHRGSPQLPYTFCDAVHAVDVGLAELTAVGVDGQPPAHLDGPIGDVVLGFTLAAEPQLLQLNQREGSE